MAVAIAFFLAGILQPRPEYMNERPFILKGEYK